MRKNRLSLDSGNTLATAVETIAPRRSYPFASPFCGDVSRPALTTVNRHGKRGSSGTARGKSNQTKPSLLKRLLGRVRASLHLRKANWLPRNPERRPIKRTLQLLLIWLFVLQACAQWTEAANILASSARNVKDYGAKGDGVTDDTQAFLDALNKGRHPNPASSYFAPTAIYVPPGTYLIKQTLILWAQTILFGEWTNPPTLLLAPSSGNFQNSSSANPFIVTASGYNTNEYSSDWRARGPASQQGTNQSFFTFLEDLKIKVGANNPGCDHAVFWACAQQTGIRNVTIDGGNAAYAVETGLDGGGGVFDGLNISNSVNGFVSNATSQGMVRNCTFNCPVTINNYYLSSWGFIGCTFNHPSGFTSNSPVAVSLLDCQFLNNSPLSGIGLVHLEHAQFSSRTAVPPAMQGSTDSTGLVGQYTTGNVISNNATISGSAVGATDFTVFRRSASIAYPRPSSACVNIRTLGAKGDGIADDSAVIQNALNNYSDIFFPLGTYHTAGQLHIASGKHLYGQGVGTLIQSATNILPSGSNSAFVSVAGSGISIVGIWFWNESNGKCGEFNVDGSSSVLDCMFWNNRVGNPSVVMNFIGGCGGLFENMWETGGLNGISVSSNGPLELFAVAPEHYQVASLTFNGASNVLGINIQSEAAGSYVTINNSNNIYLASVLAANWGANSDDLVTINNSTAELFGLQINQNASCIVLDQTSNPPLRYGPASGASYVTLNGFIKQ